MYHIYEIEADTGSLWDVYVSDDTYGPADYRESFEDYNDLVTFLDKCTDDGVEFHLYPLSDWN